MKVRVKFQIEKTAIDEVFTGSDASEVTKAAKLMVAKKLGGIKGWAVKRMSNVDFANKVIDLYCKAFKKDHRGVKSCDEFIGWAVSEKLAEIQKETK